MIPDLHASSALVDDEAIAVTLLVRTAIGRDPSSSVVVDSFAPGDAPASCKRLGADHAIVGELTSDKGLRVELSIVDPAGNFDRATLRAPEGDIVGLATAIVDKITASTRVRGGVVPPVTLGALRPYAAAIRLARTDKEAAAGALEDVTSPVAIAVPAIGPAIAGVVDAAPAQTKVIVARAAGDTKTLEDLAVGDPAARALLAIDRANLGDAAAALVKPPKNNPTVAFAQAVLAEHKGEDALLAKTIQGGLNGPLKRTMLAYASTVAPRLPAPLVKTLLGLAAQSGTQPGVASRIGLAALEAGIEPERASNIIRISELDTPELARLKRAIADKTDPGSKRLKDDLAAREAPATPDKPTAKPPEVKPATPPAATEGGGSKINALTIGAIAIVLLGVIGLLVVRSRGKNPGGCKLQLMIDKPLDAVDEVYCIEFSQHPTRPATGDIAKFHADTKRAGPKRSAMRQTLVGSGQTIDAPKGRWRVHLFGAYVRNGVVRPVPSNCSKDVEIAGTAQVRFDVGARATECAVVVTSEPRQGIDVWAGNSANRVKTDARGEAVLALQPGNHTIHLEVTNKKVDKMIDVAAGRLLRVEIDMVRDSAPANPVIDKDKPIEIATMDGASAFEGPGGHASQPAVARTMSKSQPRGELGAQLQSLIDVDLSQPTPKPGPPPQKSPTVPPQTKSPTVPPQTKPQASPPHRPSQPPPNKPTNAIMDDLAMPPSITMPPPMAAAPQQMARQPKAVTLPPQTESEGKTTIAPRPSRPSRPPDPEAMRLDIGTFELDNAPSSKKSQQVDSYGIDTSIPAASAPFHDPSAIDVGGGGGGLGASLASLATELDGSFLDRFTIVGPLGPNIQLARDAQGRDVEIRTYPGSAPLDDLAKIQHPNVARTVSHALEGSSAYLASEHLGGDTLAYRLQNGGAMSWLEAVGIVDQVCAGLGALHGRMIAHGNIDLGAIAIVDRTAKLSAPMLRGNARDDLAAIGRVMYELICGHPPARPVVRPRSVVPDVPAELDQMIMSLLEKNAASSQDLRTTFKKLLNQF